LSRRAAVALAIAGPFLASTGQAAEWLAREFSKGWDVPGHSVADFLNKECMPSGLDGIQMFAVQTGHDSPYNLHIYCRKDGSAGVRYKVSMATFPRAQFAATVNEALARGNVRIGPFRFGDANQDDGLLLVEKLADASAQVLPTTAATPTAAISPSACAAPLTATPPTQRPSMSIGSPPCTVTTFSTPAARVIASR
jgi:hypothetical protein